MKYNSQQSERVHYTRLLSDQTSRRRLSLKYIIPILILLIIVVFVSIQLWRRLQIKHHRSQLQTDNSTKNIECQTCMNSTSTTISDEITTEALLSITSQLDTYINKSVYIQSIDHPDRYLSKTPNNWNIYLLPFSSTTTSFIVRPCLWSLFEQTYSNFTCISLECVDKITGKYLIHGNYRVYVETKDQEVRSNFIGDASFLIDGDVRKFQLRSTIAMKIETAIWLQYRLPSFAVYMHQKHDIADFHYFRFVFK